MTWKLGIALALASAGCFTKPDAPGGTPPGDGRLLEDDGATHDAAPPCLVRDNFEAGTGSTADTACGTWAMYKGGGSHILTRNSGQLLAYTTSNDASAACVGTVEVPFTNVVVQVASIVPVMGAQTGIQLTFNNALLFTLEIRSNDATSASVYTITDTDSPVFLTNYSGGTMQYFRFARRGTSGLDLSFSSDGTMWPVTYPFELTTALQTVAVSLYVNFGSNVSEFVSARFDNLDACAP